MARLATYVEVGGTTLLLFDSASNALLVACCDDNGSKVGYSAGEATAASLLSGASSVVSVTDSPF